MKYTVPEDGVIFTRKPGFFGNPVVSVKVMRDRYILTRKKSDAPETVMFPDIDKVSVSRYDTSNADYTFSIKKKDQSAIDFSLDPGRSDDTMNYVQTKTCLTAYTQFVLEEHFPDNIDELDINISSNTNEKAGVTLLSHGQLIIDGAAHPTGMLSEALFVATAVPYLKLVFTDGSKAKQKYLASLNLTVIEAIMFRNTGHGIDFSKGDGFAKRTSDWARARYIDDNSFRK